MGGDHWDRKGARPRQSQRLKDGPFLQSFNLSTLQGGAPTAGGEREPWPLQAEDVRVGSGP